PAPRQVRRAQPGPAPLLVASLGGGHLPRGARGAGRGRRRPRGRPHLDAVEAVRLDGLRPADRRPDDRRGARAARGRGALLRLRPDGAGRGRRQRPRTAGPPGRSGPDRAVRPNRNVSEEEEPMTTDVDESLLDGNAVAGLLAATFGRDMTTTPSQCA